MATGWGGEASSFRAACGSISFREGLIRKHTQAATDDQLSGPRAMKFLCQDVPSPQFLFLFIL